MQTSTFTLRAPTLEDVPALADLETAWAVRSGEEWTTNEDDILHEWSRPGFVREDMIRIVEADGRIVAMHWLFPPQENSTRSIGFVHPDYRGRGFGSALLGWGVEAARKLGVKKVFTHSDEPDGYELIERMGYAYARTFVRMINRDPAATPEPEWPDGVELRVLEGQALIDAVVEALDGSFIDHWNFTPTDPEEIAHNLTEPNEDPALWFVAFGGDTVAGVNLCRVQPFEGTKRGHLGPIGTTRPFRGIGLGRALLRHGVREMAARGATQVLLGVDTENPNKAFDLYGHNGFVRANELRVFERSL